MSGLVSIVGAGPGDPDLLTLKAARRLAEATVVLHDALVSPETVARVPTARWISVGKRAGKPSARQDAINRLMVRLARRGERVVRLKGGDPFVLGRGGEEGLALSRAGIPFETIPGISSSIAAPALAGIPVTHRGIASGFLVVSGHAEHVYGPILDGVAPHSVTVVVLMGLGSRGDLSRFLIERGWSSETPAAVVQAASTPDQAAWIGTLEELGSAEIARDFAGTIVIGEVVSLARTLSGQPPRRHSKRPFLWRPIGVTMFSIDDPKTFGPTRLGFADAKDVDQFVDTLAKFERGEIDSDAWRLFRLVNGVYGQRQDAFMMIRVKIPQGILSPPQLRALADVAERWSNGKGHVTTRQNVQFHFVKLEHAEAALRHLAEAGLTTREACGNSVRNVTTCPFAGVSPVEPFDPTPCAEALTRHLLRGPLSSTLPRKFKIAFGGCCGTDCVNAAINDLGFHATVRDRRPGFRFTIGGGTATLTRSGFVAHDFLPAGEILEAAEAVVRVFNRRGNRQNKHKARLKFVIEKLGREGFLAEVAKEREAIHAEGGRPYSLPVISVPASRKVELPDEIPPLGGFHQFALTNVVTQKQPGYSSVIIRLPLGDITADQLRALATLVVGHGEGGLRTTHDQNIVIRFVASERVSALHRELSRVSLALPGARTAADVTSCPGAASCKLAVTASRGLAGIVSSHLESRPDLVAKAGKLQIKVSGCPNGCGQHHVAGIGFQGGVRKVEGRAVPQYHLLLGGGVDATGATFGRFAGKIPARRVPVAVERLIGLYGRDKEEGEAPERFFARVDLARVEALISDLAAIEASTAREEDYVDLGETKAFQVEVGSGECAT